MRSMIDYCREEQRPFSQLPFHDVDSLVLSQLAYLNWEGRVPKLGEKRPPVFLWETVKGPHIEQMYEGLWTPQKNRQLLQYVTENPRFRNLRLKEYVNHIDEQQEKQFSALVFLMEDDTAYVAFRGTDATFIGWKEDLNMAFLSPIPSQEESVTYLNTVGKSCLLYTSIAISEVEGPQ